MWVIVIVVGTMVLVSLGLWRRDRVLTEAADARRDRRVALTTLATLQGRVRNTVLAARSLEIRNDATRRAADDLEHVVADLVARIDTAERVRNDAAVSAYIAGGQLGQLRVCLNGVTRALNEVSVADPNSVATLEAVGPACRAVGA